MKYKSLNFGISSTPKSFKMLSEEPTKASLEPSTSAMISWCLAKCKVLMIMPWRQYFKNVDSLSTKASVSMAKAKSASSVISFLEMVSHPNKKIADIINLQTPTSASNVRSLLGMTNYCSRFISDHTTKTKPLQSLTHKDQPLE